MGAVKGKVADQIKWPEKVLQLKQKSLFVIGKIQIGIGKNPPLNRCKY